MTLKKILPQIICFAIFAILSSGFAYGVQIYLGDQLVGNTHVAPLTVSGEVLVPARPLIDILGGEITWNPNNQI